MDFSENQRRTKGQQPKDRIVSVLSWHFFMALFHTFHTFSELFRIFPPGLFLRIKGFYCKATKRDQKRIKIKDPTILHVSCCTFVLLRENRGFAKGWFPKGRFWRMFPGTKTGTRVHSHVPPVPKSGTRVHSNVPRYQKLERGNIHQNHPFSKPPFCFLSRKDPFSKRRLFPNTTKISKPYPREP